MTIKSGVEIGNLHPDIKAALKTIDALWPAVFPEDTDGMTVTSGHEEAPVHSEKSRHYIRNNASGMGEAVDIRLNDVRRHKATVFAGIAWEVLTLVHGDLYEIFAENILSQNAHLHIETK